MSGYRPLTEVAEALEKIGFNISYAFDDLLFIEHSHFLLKYDADDVRTLHFYTHIEIDEARKKEILDSVSSTLKEVKFNIIESGTFDLKESESGDNNLDILFYEKRK